MGLIYLIMFGITNIEECNAVAPDWSKVDAPYTSESTFLCIQGMNAIADGESAEEKASVHSIGKLRDQIVKMSLVEAFVVHGLFLSALYWGQMVAHTLLAHLERDEGAMTVLTCCVLLAKFQIALASIQASFYIRANQRFSEFEIRRLQKEIREATFETAEHLSVRIKKVLKENYNTCNKMHKFLFMWAPMIIIYVFFVLLGVIQAEKTDFCIHFWIFVGALQPLLSTVVFIHGFARLNLFLERDLEQDVVELALKLEFDEEHVEQDMSPAAVKARRSIITQLFLIEKLEGKACVLPFDYVPAMHSSRQLMKSVGALFVLMGPYVIFIMDKLSFEYMCLNTDGENVDGIAWITNTTAGADP